MDDTTFLDLRTCRVVRLPNVSYHAEPKRKLMATGRPWHSEVKLGRPLARKLGIAAAVVVRVSRLEVLQLNVMDHAGSVAQSALHMKLDDTTHQKGRTLAKASETALAAAP